MENKLTAKQQRFVEEYLIDLNGTQAAIRAGYSKKTANVISSENLAKPNISAEIVRLRAARSKRTEVTADSVVEALAAVRDMDVADIMTDDWGLKPISEWPDEWRRNISGLDVLEIARGGEDAVMSVLKKIKWPDKLKTLELLGRHAGAFVDRHELTGANGGPIETHELSDIDRANRLATILDRARATRDRQAGE